MVAWNGILLIFSIDVLQKFLEQYFENDPKGSVDLFCNFGLTSVIYLSICFFRLNCLMLKMTNTLFPLGLLVYRKSSHKYPLSYNIT